MLKVLIVDDEPAALRSLRYLIPWEETGFTVSAVADCGERALELDDEQRFDLIITDIKMPGMDGLQLASAVRSRSDTPVFIVSGFHEFDYARQGIQLGVKDYLLKPVEAEELLRCLDHVKRELARKARLEQTLYRSLPALREQAAERWARGSREALGELAELGIGPEWEYSRYAVMLIELDDSPKKADGTSAVDDDRIRLRCFAVRNITDERAGRHGLSFREDGDRRIVMIIKLHEGLNSERQLADWAERLRQDLIRYAKEEVWIAIGGVAGSPEELPRSYEAALAVSRYRRNARESLPVATSEEVLGTNEAGIALVRQAERIIRRQFKQNAELKRLAAELHVNPNYLGQQFRSVTGMTFKDYVTKLRMETAKELLLYTDKKVYEIADEVGIRDLDWFYKRFKAYAGISANEFRAQTNKKAGPGCPGS